MKYYINIIALLVILVSCRNVTDQIPQGEWKYKLFVNEIEVGTAVISNTISGSNFVSSSEYEMKLADMNTVTKDIITETKDFRPVKLESYSRIKNSGKLHETKIISVFNGNNVELTFGDKKYNYTVKSDFIIDGNFFMSKLVEAKFRQGYEISNYVYNPSIEPETPIKATTKVIGTEKIMVNGKELDLIHVTQSIENIKDNIDLFLDSSGVLQKGIISMLNIKIELIKI